ncbi:MAG: FtsQ-type POTRA domain-containing protein [Dermabacter sp.]|nr:FtsQ-type POTRA domain-containing protein [Dermabacter sp.]
MSQKRPPRPKAPARRVAPRAAVPSPSARGPRTPTPRKNPSAPTPGSASRGAAPASRSAAPAAKAAAPRKAAPPAQTRTPRAAKQRTRPASAAEEARTPAARTVIDARDRFLAAVRPRPWRRRRRPLLIAALAAVSIAALVVLALAYLPWLTVQKVQVDGVGYVAADEVARVVDPLEGQALAFVDTGAVKKQVASIPGVKSVTTSRQWPSTLRVRVTERLPAALVERDGAQEVVDHGGVSLPQAAADGRHLPVLAVEPGAKDPEATEATLLEVLGVLPTTVTAQTSRIYASTPSNVTLTLWVDDQEKTVVWGGPEDSALKAQVVAALAHQPGTIIDVSAPEAPTLR